MSDVKSFAKKFENEIDVNALRIYIKISIIEVIKSSNNALKKNRRNDKSKKQRVEINALMIEIKSFVKKFRDDVTNENEMSKNFRKMTTTNFRSTNITITNEFAKNCRVELTSDFAKNFFVLKTKVWNRFDKIVVDS